MTRGFVIMAQDTTDVKYTSCANALQYSILRVMPNANVTIVTTDMLPYGDLEPNSNWKLINDWQVYDASPYDETIKLEADMFMPKDISHWWDILKDRDVVISTTARNYKGEISDCRVYRKFIDENNLPDCYNAITYFKKSETAKQFYEVVRNVFENWDEFKKILKCNPTEVATTDFVYAIASLIVGVEKTTFPGFTDMSIVHMKQYINAIPIENWTDIFVYECLPDVLRINTCPQQYPFHYVDKNFANVLLDSYK